MVLGMNTKSDPSEGVLRNETGVVGNPADYAHLVKDAATADAAEHTMSVRQAFKIHKKAVFWSMALSAALIMEGYDVVIIGSFYGHPSFLRRFGETAEDGTRYIPAQWQSALSNGSSAGGIIGLMINGWAAERFGPKQVYLAGMVAMVGAIFITFFANSLGMLVAGEVICGLPWGVFQTLTTAYAAEVCPIQLRGYLSSYVNFCWGVGILISSGVAKATITDLSDMGWKLPFALQWIWPVPLFIMACFVPQSPWWLVRQGRYQDAERSVARLTDAEHYSELEVKQSVAMMIHTTEMEKQTTAGASYIDCFRGVDRRRSEIAMMVFAGQLLSGQNLIGQGVQFLQRAGIDTEASFSVNMGLNSMFCIGTICSWFLLSKFGRRTLYISGFVCMDIVLLIIGGLAFKDTSGTAWASGILLICLNLIYNSTLGPVCYTLISEVGSTRLRQKTVVLARISYQIMNIICGIIVPRMLSPDAWNLRSKSAFVFVGTCTLTLIYMILRLPETRNRSYGELDILFENRVPAWRFSKTKVDQFNLEHHQEELDHSDKQDLKGDAEHAEYPALR